MGLSRGGVGLVSDVFAVGTSSGNVEVWRFVPGAWSIRLAKEEDFSQLRVVETGARLTCMIMWVNSSEVSTMDTSHESGEIEEKVVEMQWKRRRKIKRVQGSSNEL